MEIFGEMLQLYGLNGLVYLGLFSLIVWVVKKYDRNEDRLYKIIDTLSTKFETLEKSNKEITDTLLEIKNELKRGK